MVKVEKSQLINISKDVQNNYNKYYENCFEISNKISNKYKNIGINSTTLEVAIGEAREVHFIVSVPSKQIKDVNTNKGNTYIDATIRQYSLKNWKSGKTEVCLGRVSRLPEIAIFPPEREERKVWYYSVNNLNI